MKKYFTVASLLAVGTAMACASTVGWEVVLPDNADLTFKFDYAANSDTPTVNNENWSWTHYWTEVPTIENGVAQFSSGGPYTYDAVGFDVNNFTVAFDISGVTNSTDGAVLVFGQKNVATYFYVTASTTSVKLFSDGSEALVSFDVDLTGETVHNIIVSNSESGSFIAVDGLVAAESENHISGGELFQYFNVGARFEGGLDKINGTLDNLALYGASASAIPEPSAFGLFAGIGALALIGMRRRRK